MYPRAETYFNFSFQHDIHLTEESLKDPSSPLCKYMLFSEWRAYWNLSRPILVEKSPRHMLMTRLLQYYFTAERSFFVVVMRHPYGTVREIMNGRYQMFYRDCGAEAIEHWLMIYETLFEDLQHIQHRVVMHLEKFVEGDTQGLNWSLCVQLTVPHPLSCCSLL